MSSIYLLKQTLQNTNKVMLIMTAIITAGIVIPSFVSANTIEQQIQSLQNENTTLRASSQSLTTEAASIEAVAAELQSEITALETQINDNRIKQVNLQTEIADAEAKLAEQRRLLGENIKTMYLEGDISTLEMLASSGTIGDFVDQQQYRLTIEERISEMHTQVTALVDQLSAQKIALDNAIADQAAIQTQLSAQRAEQARLLALNEQERSNLSKEVQANNAQVVELRRQQAIENARLFRNGTIKTVDSSGYPYANVQPFPNAIVDPWGMYMRQCVSYTAWKVAASGRHMPYWGGFGNANRWAVNARRAGIPVDRTPRVGDVAVSLAGYYGHVMYVEAVYGDGTILISQYNAAWDGKYSEARIPVGNLEFIHF